MEDIFFRAGIFLVVLLCAFRMWCVMLLISVSISCVLVMCGFMFTLSQSFMYAFQSVCCLRFCVLSDLVVCRVSIIGRWLEGRSSIVWQL